MARPLHPDLAPEERRRLFVRGADLFNAGAFYDCHECFEEIWRSTTPQPRDLHQGLIQVAVGLHHWRENGRLAVAGRVLARGRRRLDGLPPRARAPEGCPDLGVDVAPLLEAVDRWLDWLERPAGPPPPPPRLRLVGVAPGGGRATAGTTDAGPADPASRR